jgi:hypothetical protein
MNVFVRQHPAAGVETLTFGVEHALVRKVALGHLAVALVGVCAILAAVFVDAAAITLLSSDGVLNPDTLAMLERLRWLAGGLGAVFTLYGVVGCLFPAPALAAYRFLGEAFRRRLVVPFGDERGQVVVSPLTQLRALRPALAWTLGLTALVLGLTLVVHAVTGTPLVQLSRDPAATLMAPAEVGMLSNLGIVAWAAALTVCLFPALVLAKRCHMERARTFLIASGVFTATLMLDDLFLLHESVLPEAVGMPETLVLVLYAGAFAVYVGAFWAEMLRTPYILFVLACVCFGLSMGIDIVLPFVGVSFIEDSAKFAGILLWLVYFAKVAEARFLLRPEDITGQRGAQA